MCGRACGRTQIERRKRLYLSLVASICRLSLAGVTANYEDSLARHSRQLLLFSLSSCADQSILPSKVGQNNSGLDLAASCSCCLASFYNSIT